MISEPNLFDPKILVVDDDSENLTRYLRRLGRLGYTQVTSALSAKEAQIKLEKEFFDLIIADMRMEAEDSGFVIIEEVKRRKITSVVIVLTANDTVEDCRRAFKAGAWDYIAKGLEDPFEPLHQAIQEAMAYFKRWGTRQDESWIDENIVLLDRKYAGQWIAVLNNSVIEAAATHEELEQQLKERKLPLFIPYICQIGPLLEEPLQAELTVFVEGPTDVKYLEAAARALGKKPLLERIILDNIGNTRGDSYGGVGSLQNGFNFLLHNPKFRPHKVLFLFDQDVPDSNLPKKGEGRMENLFVRRMGQFDKQQKGVEFLFTAALLEEGFARRLVEKDLGRATIDNPQPLPTYYISESNKMRLCDWLCTERENTPEDFAGFGAVFAIIEEILKIP